MDRRQAAFYCGLSPRRFKARVKSGEFPPPVTDGKPVLWDRLQLDQVLDKALDEAARAPAGAAAERAKEPAQEQSAEPVLGGSSEPENKEPAFGGPASQAGG